MQPDDHISEEDLLRLGTESGYYFPVRINPKQWALIARRVTHYDIIAGGKRDVDIGWADQWSYRTWNEAIRALRDWKENGYSEPKGWHRHMPSNRRIDSEGKIRIEP